MATLTVKFLDGTSRDFENAAYDLGDRFVRIYDVNTKQTQAILHKFAAILFDVPKAPSMVGFGRHHCDEFCVHG